MSLAAALRASGFELSAEVISRLDRYSALLRQWGGKMSLVGPEILRDPTVAILESLEPLRHFGPPARLLDVGTGGGIPAIPLAVAWPAGWSDLVEPRRKRWSFLVRTLRELDLSGQAHEARIEDFSTRYPADVLTLRGVPTPGDWLRRLRPSVVEGGVGLLWSGEERRSELESPGWRVEREIPLRASGHRLYVLRAFPVEQRVADMRQSQPPEGSS